MSATTQNPTEDHLLTVVFLHGSNSDGSEFFEELLEAPGSDMDTLPEMLPGVKWIFPTAPERFSASLKDPITDWFEIVPVKRTPGSVTNGENEDDEDEIHGLAKSINQVHQILRREIDLVGAHRVVIGGIGQGCGIALHALLSLGKPLAGFIGLCGWAPFDTNLLKISVGPEKDLQAALVDFYASTVRLISNITTEIKVPKETPVFIAYSLDDEVVLAEWSRQLWAIIENFGMPLQVKEYNNCGHWIQEHEGIDDIQEFLATTLDLANDE